jgi:hypothetical protein
MSFSVEMQLADTIGQGGLHCWSRAKGAQHHDGGDGLGGELRGHVIVDRRQTEYLDMQLLSGCPQALELLAGVPLQTEHQ